MTGLLFPLLVALLSRETGIGTVRPYDIMAESRNVWSLRSMTNESVAYRAMELSWSRPHANVPRVEGIGSHIMYTMKTTNTLTVFVSADHSIIPSDIRIYSGSKPAYAGFRLMSRIEWIGRDSLPTEDGLIWVIRQGNPLPKPWISKGLYPRTMTSDSPENLPGYFQSDGTGRFETNTAWNGMDAARYPVALVQYQVDSGFGNATISWKSDGTAAEDSMNLRIHPFGLWNQMLIPLYNNSGWRGNITAVSFSPVDHPANFQFDWITFPELHTPWSWIINSKSVQTVTFGIVCLTVIIVALMFKQTKRPDRRYLLIVACAITPILIPFECLQATISFIGISAPLYLLILAILSLYTIVTSNVAWVVRSAVICIVFSLVHGYIVAKGTGSETLPVILSGPFAFLAAYGISAGDHRRNGIGLIVGTITLSGIWIVISSITAHDPLYESLLKTIGRTYHDISSEGRISGAFVHPLVLASCAVVSISVLHGVSRAIAIRIPLLVVLSCIVIMTHSRSAILVVFLLLCITLFRYNRRSVYILVLGGLLVFLILVMARSSGSQGMLRELHLSKRTAGIEVAANTISHKPLQGVGWGNYKRAMKRFGPDRATVRSYTTPDSSYVRMATEGGLLGLFVWFGWFASLWSTDKTRSRIGSHGYAISGWRFTILVIFFMAGVFDALYWPAFSVPAFTLLGFMKS